MVGSGNFRLSQNHLMRLNPEDLSTGLLPVPVSERDTESICFQIHEDLGHRNEKDVIEAVRKRYWFPNISKTVRDTIALCSACQIHAAPSGQQGMPVQLIKRGDPFRKWGMDFVGPLTKTANGNCHLVTAIDYGTGWAYAVPITRTSAMAAIELVKEIIRNHGVPLEITSNNGSEFISDEFKGYLHSCDIKHITTSPYHPQANGLVERFHGTLINSLRKCCSPYNQNLWDEYLNNALFAYRCSFSQSMKASPFFMTYGAEVRLPSENGSVSLPIDSSDENLELMHRQRYITVDKLRSKRAELIEELNERANARYTEGEDSYTERNLRLGGPQKI